MGRLELGIEFDYVDKFGTPQVAIMIDSDLLYSGNVQSTLNLDTELINGKHLLKIIHSDKKINDFDETHDRHIVIKKIMFSGVDLDQIEYCKLTHKGKFYPEYNESYIQTCLEQGITLPEYISPNHYLGHNGTWELEFESPVYDWIIKEQKPSGINLEDTIFSTGNDSLNAIKDFFNV